MKPRNQYFKYGFGAVVLASAAQAHAAVDVAAIVTEIGLVQAAAVLIGIAILTMAVSVKAYRWLKGAL